MSEDETEVEKYKRLYEEQRAKVKELERQNSQLKVRRPCSYAIVLCAREFTSQRSSLLFHTHISSTMTENPEECWHPWGARAHSTGILLYTSA